MQIKLIDEDANAISLIVKKYIEEEMGKVNLILKVKTDEYEKITQQIIDNVRKCFSNHIDYLLNEYQQEMNYRNKIIKMLDMTVVNLDDSNTGSGK